MSASSSHALCRVPIGRGLLCAILALLAISSAALAQTTRPLAGAYEDQPIRRTLSVPPTTRGASSSAASDRSSGLLDFRRVALALAIVVALILGLRWLSKRLFPGLAAGRATGIVRVLSRSHLTPRQQVLLVQVGRRILVVADNGAQVQPLSEITDPDEVASLVGQAGAQSVSSSSRAFGSALNTAKSDFEQKLGDQPVNDPPLESLGATELPSNDDSIACTRGEIAGLMEKVRGLARQLGRS